MQQSKSETAEPSDEGPKKEREILDNLHVLSDVRPGQHCEMVVTLGLHPGIHAAHQHPVVQHSELSGDRVVPERHVGDDPSQDFAQGYR